MYKKVEFVLLVLLLIGLATAGKHLSARVSSEKAAEKGHVVVVDCGHGGSDPGKVGAGDILEKDINLKIGKLLKKKLEKKGMEVIMTREEDKVLADEESVNTKVQDMKERVAIINKTAPFLAVSIHQNSYEDAAVSGAQVFYYSHSAEGETAAKTMQEALLNVNPDNKRQAKSNDTYYLLKRTEVPTIIVECGFLSNPEEAALLSGEEYQGKIAEAVANGVEKYLESK